MSKDQTAATGSHGHAHAPAKATESAADIAADREKKDRDKKSAEDEARDKSDHKSKAEAAKKADEADERVKKAEAAAAKSQAAVEKMIAENEKTQQKLNQALAAAGRSPDAPVMRIRNMGFDAAKATAKRDAKWDEKAKRRPSTTPIVGKSYVVKVLGENKSNFQPMIVDNCSDEADAKAAFFAANGVDGFKMTLDAKQTTAPAGEAVA